MDRYDHSKRVLDPLGSRLFIQNFNFSGGEMNFDLNEVMIPPRPPKGFLSENYWVHPHHNEEAFKIDVFEMNSFDDASEVLEDLLQHHMNPEIAPWEDKLDRLGEIAFGGMTHILFSRANLVNVINSIGSNDIDVSGYAMLLDTLFTSFPDLKENENSVFIPKLQLVSRGKNEFDIQLENGQEAKNKGVWFKYVVQGGSIRKIDEQLRITADDISEGVTIYAYLGSNAIEKKRIRL